MPRLHDDMRRWMKACRFIPNTPEQQEQANLVNTLLPALVDGLTDEQLNKMFAQLVHDIVKGLPYYA